MYGDINNPAFVVNEVCELLSITSKGKRIIEIKEKYKA